MQLLSKLLGLFTQPLHGVVLLLLLAVLASLRRSRHVRSFTIAALLLLLATGFQALPDMLIRHLENQYAEMSPQANLSAYTGLVVLGGATESGHVQQAHSQPLFNDAAERMTAPLIMLRRNPHLRVLYTGGEGALLGTGPSEADRARLFYESVGLPASQIGYESQSRNTYENAVLTAQMPGVNIQQRWLLVTSASHMPRAMGSFLKAGWNVTAYPVDFRTGVSTPWTEYSIRSGSSHWELALHELLGILAYRLSGRM